tara:strand:+ start:550 stop:1767 length:1218 start_codon:yes stop_codon:yes gene_type:complete
MAKKKKEEVAKATDEKEVVETKMADDDGKLKVKKRPSLKGNTSDEPVKVDMSKPVEKPAEEEQVQEQPKEDTEQEVPAIEEVVEEEEKVEEETETPVIEEVTADDVKEEVEKVEEVVEEAVKEAEQTGRELPENIEKLVNFMEETGGDIEDYVKLNQDYSKLDDTALLREYYRQTKPHLSSDEVDFLMEDSFTYDEDVDEVNDVKRKKLAFKEQVANARTHLDGLKSKYYEEIRGGAKLAPEQQKAIDFFNRYNEEKKQSDKLAEQQRNVFQQKTNEVFNKNFKGFEYNVGGKTFRINVKDVNNVKEAQSDIGNFVNKFLNKKQEIEDGVGYHKSLYTALNADAIANHFYEQGKADGVKQSIDNAKNIDMSPREGFTEPAVGGIKVRAISGDSPDKLRFKIRNKT